MASSPVGTLLVSFKTCFDVFLTKTSMLPDSDIFGCSDSKRVVYHNLLVVVVMTQTGLQKL